jgi:hypothetical protein
MNILFITSTNLAANPRLAKELRFAYAKGYICTVIQFTLGNWSDKFTLEMQKDFEGVQFISLSGTRSPFLPWLISSFLEYICYLIPIEIASLKMISYSIGKRSFLIFNALIRLKNEFSWIIAHNPTAFYPAYWFANKLQSNLGIDIEDYHPGEADSPKDSALIKMLMLKILPSAKYVSYASPLISAEVQKDIPKIANKSLVILNGFDSTEFLPPVTDKKNALRLVWFSQNIDTGRGLENIISAVNQLYPEIELELIGNINPEFQKKYLKSICGITIHQPMSQKILHQYLSHCDIGLAADIPINKNRRLALTNKIIAYVQAGLFIVATNTSAHINFLNSRNLDCRIVDGSYESYRSIFIDLIKKKEEIRLKAKQRYEYGQQYDAVKLYKPLFELFKSIC